MLNKLSTGRSDFLDALRWLAAVTVVVGHAQMYHRFVAGRPAATGVWDYVGSHAHAAVMVFFVLSGFVVAFSTDKKQGDNPGYGLRDYVLDRWSRIYSVLIAAIVLTIVLDTVGARFSPAYADPELIPQTHYWLRVFLNVAGLQGSWGYRAQMGSNPALWSIAYELAFYALWGAWHFKREIAARSRWLLAIIVVVWFLIFGWKIAYYFLLWLLGVFAWHVVREPGRTPLGVLTRLRIPYVWLLLAIALLNHFVNYNKVLGANEIVIDTIFSILIALIMCVDALSPSFAGDKVSAVNHYMAEFSYSIYAYHLPIIFFVCAMLALFASVPWMFGVETFLLVVGSILLSRVLYMVTEKQRGAWRASLRQLIAKVS